MIRPGPEQHTEAKVCEEVRNHLKEALDKCNIPYEFTKDRLLSEFTNEVLLSKL